MQEINKRNSRIWTRLGQRGTICGVALPEILEQRENCYVLTADLAHLSGLDRVQKGFPDRFINVGIAEQNLVGVAAGLAFEGNIVFATTYATFLSMRAYEQIRHNLGYQKANVKLIGSTSGLAMGMSGNTHYSYEDIAIMRAIPNMTIISPADAAEAYMAIYNVCEYDGPVYIRLSGNLNEDIVYQSPYKFEIGKAVVMKEGNGLVLIATGGMVAETLKAAKEIEEELEIIPTVINMHTIKPLDTDILDKYMEEKIIITIEEHSIIGGLGNAVAEYIVGKEKKPLQFCIGIEDKFVHPATYSQLKKEIGLDAEGLYQKIKKIIYDNGMKIYGR